jgi:acyl transferase domain-containing protein
VEASEPGRAHQLLVLSAKTSSALESATANLAAHLKQHPDLNLADVAYTLQVGRRAFNHRRMLVCETIDDAVKALETPDSTTSFDALPRTLSSVGGVYVSRTGCPVRKHGMGTLPG